MCKFIGKCNEWFFCKLSKSEILSLYSIVHVAMETTKKSHFTCQSKSFKSVFFHKFQLVSCNLSLAMISQMTYTHKLPKLCSATLTFLKSPIRTISIKFLQVVITTLYKTGWKKLEDSRYGTQSLQLRSLCITASTVNSPG